MIALRTIALSLLIVGVGCDLIAKDNDTGVVHSDVRLEIVSGNHQLGTQFELLGEPLVIRALDEDGEPLSGVWIVAEPDDKSGSVDVARQQTNAEGNTSFSWTLGESYNNTVEIAAEGAEGEDSNLTVAAIARYAYVAPAAGADAWPVGTLDPQNSGSAQVFVGVDRIRNGDFPNVHSLLLSHKGKLVFEAYFPGFNSSGQWIDFDQFTPHEGQSSTKSFRSALIGIAIDQGYIDSVGQTIAGLFPDLSDLFDSQKSEITVQDILTMSSGIRWNEAGAASGGTDNNLSEMYALPASGWYRYLLSQPMAYEPGEFFVYNTAASLLLGEIISRSSGQSLANFVTTNMVGPMEMTRLPGIGLGTGASTIPREMAKLGQVFLDGGLWKENRVVSENWVSESFKERFNPSQATGYGYQWWMRTLRGHHGNYRIRYAAGNGGQFIIIVDDLDLVITSTGGNFGSDTMNQIFWFAETYLLDAFD